MASPTPLDRAARIAELQRFREQIKDEIREVSHCIAHPDRLREMLAHDRATIAQLCERCERIENRLAFGVQQRADLYEQLDNVNREIHELENASKIARAKQVAAEIATLQAELAELAKRTGTLKQGA